MEIEHCRTSLIMCTLTLLVTSQHGPKVTDGKCHLSFNILETKHAIKSLLKDITITSKALID